MTKTFFLIWLAIFSSLSLHGQALIERSFYSQDFEDLDVGNFSVLPGGVRFAGSAGGDGFPRETRLADGIGNPGKALERSADFSWDDPNEDAPLRIVGISNNFDDTNTSTVIRDLTDPDTQLRLGFDLWTSQASPVRVTTSIERPSRQGQFLEGTLWDGHSGKITNDQANSWQSHIIDFYAYGLTAEDRPGRALLFEGVGVSTMRWTINTFDWGHNSENILRIDNVEMSVLIPETSEYAFAIGVCLIAFATFRRIRISQTS